MILKRRSELEVMAEAGRINREALEVVASLVAPGVTTAELNEAAESAILSRGGKPSFKGYNGFPASICASPNQVVVHGFPDDRPLVEGDILSIDIGTHYRGYHADMAVTYPVGNVSVEARRLLDVTQRSLTAGIEKAHAGARLGDVSAAIQDVVEAAGYWVVREFVGHGIGRDFHEGPELPNFGRAGTGPVLRPGLVLAIEPMVAQRRARVVIADDGWTASTENGSLAAHFEHTVAITDDGPWVLTAGGGEGATSPAAEGGVHGA
ncbi:MAG: type I methionyl aminopeptidase [Trueperaceae bacterium]